MSDLRGSHSTPMSTLVSETSSFDPFSTNNEKISLVGVSFMPKVQLLKNTRRPYIASILAVRIIDESLEVQWDIEHSLTVEQYLTVHKRDLSPEQKLHWMKQLLFAVHRLHLEGILHGNISPASVRIDRDGNVLLCNFKFERRLTGNEDTAIGGYCTSLEANDAYCAASEVYSLGRLFHYIACGSPDLRPLRCYEFFNMPLFFLIKKMTKKQPAKRILLEDISTEILTAEEGTKVLVKEMKVRPPCTREIVACIDRAIDQESNGVVQKLHTDLDFLKRTRNPLHEMYQRINSVFEEIQAEKKTKIKKFPEQSKSEARKAGTEAMKAAVLYQKTGLKDYAIYTYCRALVAYCLAGSEQGPDKESIRHYMDVRYGKIVCYNNLLDIISRV